MAFIPCSSSLRGETARIPTIDVTTPTARTNSGKVTPMMAAVGATGEPEITFWRKLDTHDEVGWDA